MKTQNLLIVVSLSVAMVALSGCGMSPRPDVLVAVEATCNGTVIANDANVVRHFTFFNPTQYISDDGSGCYQRDTYNLNSTVTNGPGDYTLTIQWAASDEYGNCAKHTPTGAITVWNETIVNNVVYLSQTTNPACAGTYKLKFGSQKVAAIEVYDF